MGAPEKAAARFFAALLKNSAAPGAISARLPSEFPTVGVRKAWSMLRGTGSQYADPSGIGPDGLPSWGATYLKSHRSGQKRARHPHCCGCRANTWRRPTLTGPVVPIPSALQRFTSGFGMGPGGSTALWPPEGGPGRRFLDSGPGLWLSETPWFQRMLAVFGCCQWAHRPLSDIHTENPSFFNLNSSTEPNAVT